MSNAKQGKSLALTSFFSEDDILIGQEEILKDELIRKMLKHLADVHGIGDTESYFDAIKARELTMDTVLGHGIALPHARVEGITRPYICIATTRKGVSFTVEKPPVNMVLLVLIPKDQLALYLQLLKALSKILRSPNAAVEVSKMAEPVEVVRFFERGGLVLPDYICAADMMDTHFTSLRNNDSLKTAIDCFTSKNLNEIPVLDRDGDMVGVVSAKALLKVCLPEYLLWMEDLSPIINFQPFIHVMKNEENTWISEILTDDYPRVQISFPAISVASEMTRKDSAVCYVLNGKKLIGTISLPLFLNKIFRE